MNTSLYPIAQTGFVLLSIALVILLLREFQKGLSKSGWSRSQQRTYMMRMVAAMTSWALAVAAWSLSGVMADFSLFPLNLLPVILVPIVIAILFISSKNTAEILRHIPPANLIRLQSFRFLVEVMLWLLLVAGILPVQMTFEGKNFDILAGISAPVVAVLVSKGYISKKGIIIWNVVCLGLLVNIVVIALLSTPGPWRVFMNEPANYIVTYFPVSWLPGILVPMAYYLHFLSIRQMSQP